MKNILYFVIGLLLIVFSNTILNDIDLMFFSFRPNLILIYLVFISIYIGAEKASIIGLALGLIIDISVGKYFGYYGLLFIAVGYLYGSLKEKVFNEKNIISFSITAITSGKLCKNPIRSPQVPCLCGFASIRALTAACKPSVNFL